MGDVGGGMMVWCLMGGAGGGMAVQVGIRN